MGISLTEGRGGRLAAEVEVEDGPTATVAFEGYEKEGFWILPNGMKIKVSRSAAKPATITENDDGAA